MAIPTTAIQVRQAALAFEFWAADWRNQFEQVFSRRLIDMMMRRLFLQRPHTDDMMQMCVDLGIDVPDKQPISFDGLTFKWR